MIALPNLIRTSLLATTIAVAGCGMKPVTYGTANFSGPLSGAAEVPPTTTAASGSFEATLDKNTRTLKWTLSYSGLSGPATGAHFHGPAKPGSNAGVVVPFPNPASPIQGQTVLTTEQVADLMAGKWYANIHTAANPGGEIRGQLELH